MQIDHTPYSELQARVRDAEKKVVVGAKYYHYKNPQELYDLVGVGLLEATEQPCVMYRNEEKGVTWVRTLENFLEDVEVDGKKAPRFTKAS